MKHLLPLLLLALYAPSGFATPPTAPSPTPRGTDGTAGTGAYATTVVPPDAPLVIIRRGFSWKMLEPGDEVALFSADGVCGGTVTLGASNMAIAVWADDPVTPEKDGFYPDEPLHFRVWDASVGKEYRSPQHLVLSNFLAPHNQGVDFDRDSAYFLSWLVVVDWDRRGTRGRPSAHALGAADGQAAGAPDRETIARFMEETFGVSEIERRVEAALLAGTPPADADESARSAATAEPNALKSDPSGLADAVALEAVYPNPFTHEATVAYALPEEEHVVVEVYDLLGRPVATLVDGTVPAGRHEVRLDGTSLAAGPYVVRLRAGSATATKRIVLAR
ncbi:MAG: T9SS type A sorting domain-containing protein [Rhodothermales bacterium]|nr:T9SS type A sorting domain-containing protein [Rhodothermales bacterium]